MVHENDAQTAVNALSKRIEVSLAALQESVRTHLDPRWDSIGTFNRVAELLEAAVPAFGTGACDASAAPGSPAHANALRSIENLARLYRERTEQEAESPSFLKLELIAQEELGFEVLEDRGRDALDFVEVSVSSTRKALERAFALGAAAQKARG